MQRDLDRLRRRKRLKQRVIIVVMLSGMAALLMVGMRACSDQYQEPYNKEYRPMDTEQQNSARPEN